MNIDNLTSLILSVYNNKGVYALLLGSGISLEAKIMSGWKVTEDLIKKVAKICGYLYGAAATLLVIFA